ncbi:MAG: hypothetical protein OXG68_17755 [Chloroflexi bacterium]|nr:hypothetical protein [Chloroflexota bacterium]
MNRRKALCSVLLVCLVLLPTLGATAQEATTIKWFMRWDQNV